MLILISQLEDDIGEENFHDITKNIMPSILSFMVILPDNPESEPMKIFSGIINSIDEKKL